MPKFRWIRKFISDRGNDPILLILAMVLCAGSYLVLKRTGILFSKGSDVTAASPSTCLPTEFAEFDEEFGAEIADALDMPADVMALASERRRDKRNRHRSRIKSPRRLVRRALFKLKQGEFEKSAELLRKAESKDANYPKLFHVLGELALAKADAEKSQLMREGYRDEALIHFVEANKLDDTNPDTVFRIAQIAYWQNDSFWAKSEIRQLLKIAPFYPAARTLLAFIHLNNGELKTALKYALREKELFPGSAEAHFVLGRIYSEQRNFKSARIAFQKSSSYAPNDMASRLFVGLAFLNEENYEEAAKNIDVALRAISNNPNLYSRYSSNLEPFYRALAKAYKKSGKVDLAVAALNKVNFLAEDLAQHTKIEAEIEALENSENTKRVPGSVSPK